VPGLAEHGGHRHSFGSSKAASVGGSWWLPSAKHTKQAAFAAILNTKDGIIAQLTRIPDDLKKQRDQARAEADRLNRAIQALSEVPSRRLRAGRGVGQECGQPELRDFCLVEHVLKKHELIGLLLSRAGHRLLLLATSASPIATESFRHLADKILVPKRPRPAGESDSSDSAFRTCSQSAAGSRRHHSMSSIPLSSCRERCDAALDQR
jgi:hypothetical protein